MDRLVALVISLGRARARARLGLWMVEDPRSIDRVTERVLVSRVGVDQ